MPISLKQLAPLRVIIGSEDVTQYVQDSGFTFSNVDPGGFEASSMQFPRDLPQTLRGQYMRIDSGLKVAWEGRVSQIQRSLGHSTTINGEGYGALFKDDAASMVFVDRDLTRWQNPSFTRQQAMFTANKQFQSSQVGTDQTYLVTGTLNGTTSVTGITAIAGSSVPPTGTAFPIIDASGAIPNGATITMTSGTAGTLSSAATASVTENLFIGGGVALVQQIQNSWATPWIPQNESFYDAGPQNLIAKVYYNLSVQQAVIGTWQETINLSSDAAATTVETSGALTPPTAAYFTPATALRFAFLHHLNSVTSIGTQGATYNAYWQSLAVYGNHGLTGRGNDPVGFYPSDIFGWAVGKTPGLQAGVVLTTDASGYIVPHYVQYTPVTLDTIVGDQAAIQGWHWGVWDALAALTGSSTPRADFRPRPAAGTFTAFCRRADCDTLDVREDLSQQYNQAWVNYTDVAGVPGAVLVSADNPILDQAGIASRTVVFAGGTMTAATATVFGLEALQILNSEQRVAGSIDLISPVDSPSGPMPGWLLKAGVDRLRVGDLPCTDAWGALNDVPIQRVECSVSTGGMNTSVEVGSGGNLVETLQARLSAATSLAAQGGA